MARIVTLLGHDRRDIGPVMNSVGARYAGVCNSKKTYEASLKWFSPKPHVEFRREVYHYRTGSPFNSGSVMIYVNEKGVVYAVQFLDDASPRKQ